jgi:hypothetical protein
MMNVCVMGNQQYSLCYLLTLADTVYDLEFRLPATALQLAFVHL